ncbi:MAG TPA: ATP-binding protein [Candidatus Binatia bacterium]|jgi:signal transduction histidine kinase
MKQEPPSVTGTPKEFHLLKRFALLSFLCIAALTVTLWVVVSYYLTKEMLDREWQTTAQFIRTETRQFVTPEDFTAPDPARVAHKFQTLHDQITAMPDLVRLKIYNPQGIILWSDETRLIGTTFENNPELQEAFAGEVVADVSSVEKGENVFEKSSFKKLVELYIPIFSDDGRTLIGVIETYKSADALYRDIQRARVGVLLVTLAGGLLLYLSLFAIVRRGARQINEQRKNLLKMQSELVASQRMAAIGEMAAAVAHGIGNPLSSIRASAQVAKLDCADCSGQDLQQKTLGTLDGIMRQVDRVQLRMRGLLNFVSPLEPHRGTVEVNALVRDAVNVLRARYDEAGVASRLELDTNVPVLPLDPNHIEQVIQGLLTNALEATPRGGTVTISTEVRSVPGDSKAVSISIEDTGEGIPVENRERVFEPFFTTKAQGTGLGLPLAKKFVERNGGSIAITEAARGGTRIEVTLPIAGAN